MYHEGAESVNESTSPQAPKVTQSGGVEAGEFERLFDGPSNRIGADSTY
jgi:hypothetical protein